ncbi:hypothetical protein BIW11_09093 [Tropilaelaps mercedesae]|uniref:Tetratricopeptide repeat protein 37-like n=1 Tax=Tropilaelaps mercedesae TaxID=418985 RepID=A0A1V9XLK4_9ACAR|nr:hypothetical protein BIW11_09093 [Tropilaelaps mercedesae]
MGTKAQLRDARQYLDAGNFSRCIELCENVLEQDKDHYTALLLLGAAATAATGSDYSAKALKALVRATEVKRDQEAPWQGLLRLLRKHPELDKTLYRKAIQRVLDTSLDETACTLLQIEMAELDGDWHLLGNCFMLGAVAKNSYIVNRIAQVALNFLQRESPTDVQWLQKLLYSELLILGVKKPLLLAYLSLLPASVLPTEFSTISARVPTSLSDELALEVFIQREIAVIPPEKLLQVLKTQPNADTPKYALAQAKLCLVVNDAIGLKEACDSLLDSNPSDWNVWRLHLEGLLRARSYQDVESIAKQAVRSCDKKHLFSLLVYLAKGLHGQCRYREALTVLDRAEKTGAEKVSGPLRLECLLETGRAQEALEEATALQDKTWILRAHMALGGKFELDNAELSNYGVTMAIQYLLFKKRYNDALKIASAALNREGPKAEILFFLGECYLALGHPNHALKCLQQGFVQNRYDSRIGQTLSRTLRSLGKHEENFQLLETLTSSSAIHDGNCWAFFEMGLYHLEHGDPTSAVGPLQKVNTVQPSSLGWELLAEAYASRRSFAAAALAFSKSIELGSKHQPFVKYRLACVAGEQGRYDEALEQFEEALQEDPSSALCAYEMAKTYFTVGRNRLRAALRGPARHFLSRALVTAAQPICSGHSNLICLWNLLGDVMMEAMENKLQLGAPTDARSRMLLNLSEDDTFLVPEKLGTLAEKCFMRCLSLNPDLPNVWHNLAIVSASKQKFDQSISCIKRAISLDPQSASAWSSFGVLAVRAKLSLKLAQSALIRALVLDPELATAWANLGFIYMKNGLLREANQCFTRAQAANPVNVECWLEALVCHLACLCNIDNDNKLSVNIPEEMVNACERAMDSFEGHDVCSAAGYVLLTHGLTKQAETVLSRCGCTTCYIMIAQSAAARQDWEKSSHHIEGLSGAEVTRIKAYVAWKTKGQPEEILSVAPESKAIFNKTQENVEVRRKSLERAVREDPRLEDLWRQLAECLLEEGRYSTAIRIADFMEPPHRPEGLLLWTVANAMAGRKRVAYSTAAKLVRSFPDKPQHWALLRWTSLALEKRHLDIQGYEQISQETCWNEFIHNVKLLENVLKKGVPPSTGTFTISEETTGEQQCRKLVDLLMQRKFTKVFLALATTLLEADPHSEAGLFFTGIWSVANSSESLYKQCWDAMPDESILKKLLQRQLFAQQNTKREPVDMESN